MKFLFAVLALTVAASSFAADDIYTRANYPQPRILDNNSRVFPVVVSYTTDENGNVQPSGPITVDSFKYATAVASPVATTSTVVIKAATSGTKKNFIGGIQISNTGSAAVASILDGSTVIWSANIPATSGLVAIKFDPPLKGTASTATNFASSSASGSLHVSVQGFVR